MVLFKDVRYLLSETDPFRVPPCAAEVAFVGRSNVGKSSLINAILGQPLAKVSQTPGRTRTINVYQVAHGRWMVDLPGYGFAVGPEREKGGWRNMIEGYLTGRPSLKAVMLLMDAEVGPTALDIQMGEWIRSAGLTYRTVAVKADKVKPSRQLHRRQEMARALGLPTENLDWISGVKGVGVKEMRAALEALLKG